MNDDIEDEVTKGLLPGENQTLNSEGSDVPVEKQNSYSMIGLQLGGVDQNDAVPVKPLVKTAEAAPAENAQAKPNLLINVYDSLLSLGLLSPFSAARVQERPASGQQPADAPKIHH